MKWIDRQYAKRKKAVDFVHDVYHMTWWERIFKLPALARQVISEIEEDEPGSEI